MAAYGSTSAESLPDWPELRGISPSDLRIRTDLELPLIQSTSNLADRSNGLLARVATAPGVMVAFQGHPQALDSERKPYFRFSEWRWTRAISQILTNMGASFSGDELFFKFTPDPTVPIDIAGEWKVLSELTFPGAPSVAESNIDPGPESIEPSKNDFNDSAWPVVRLPAMERIGDIDWQATDGSLWARRRIEIPAGWHGMGDASLVLGAMDDHDVTYFNGTKVGSTGKSDPEAWCAPRSYRIPAWMIKPGEENTIAIRLFDQFSDGGFRAPSTPLSMRLELRKKLERPSIYVPGFITEQEMGDDPARYTRW